LLQEKETVRVSQDQIITRLKNHILQVHLPHPTSHLVKLISLSLSLSLLIQLERNNLTMKEQVIKFLEEEEEEKKSGIARGDIPSTPPPPAQRSPSSSLVSFFKPPYNPYELYTLYCVCCRRLW
jgi:hypothetical protein